MPGHYECHVLPDLLIIWLEKPKEKTITLVRTGTHPDLVKAFFTNYGEIIQNKFNLYFFSFDYRPPENGWFFFQSNVIFNFRYQSTITKNKNRLNINYLNGFQVPGVGIDLYFL